MTAQRSPRVRVLIADGHMLICYGLKSLFAGCETIEIVADAADAASAVRLARDKDAQVVLLDVSLPGRPIEDTIAQLARVGVRTVAMSEQADRRLVRRILSSGANGHLLKTAQPEEFIRAVQCVHEGKAYISPDIAPAVVEGFLDRVETREIPASRLTQREREVLRHVADGQSSRQIAEQLKVTVRTIEAHRRSISDKLQLRSIAELTKYAIREGLSKLDE